MSENDYNFNFCNLKSQRLNINLFYLWVVKIIHKLEYYAGGENKESLRYRQNFNPSW